MTNFVGFPTGKNPYVPVPEAFFTQLLPEIEDSIELKVTLHIFWLLARKQGDPRCTSDRELEGDRLLLRGLRRRGDPRPVEELLHQGLEQAVARGTLLRIQLHLANGTDGNGNSIGWYFFNTARSRKVVADLQGGEMIPARLLMHDEVVAPEQNAGDEQESAYPVASGVYATHKGPDASHPQQLHALRVEVERPNIFVLYEQNIGLLSPLIAEDLKEAADHYPAEWIEDAFREAIHHNKRKWSYIRAILRRWETEGRQQWNA